MFSPQHGSLAISSAQSTLAPINALLMLPFLLKLAMQNSHQHTHISFTSNHSAHMMTDPSNPHPSVLTTLIPNPLNEEEVMESRLWPNHCVQGHTRKDTHRDKLGSSHAYPSVYHHFSQVQRQIQGGRKE
jgi:hypothetical protein